MTKLRMEQCPECDEQVYGVVLIINDGDVWYECWTCPECKCQIFYEIEDK